MATVDHLTADLSIRVIRAFSDASGRHYPVGYRGVIRAIILDRPSLDILLEVERGDGGRDSMRFRHGAREGPRNGRMRDYFEAGDRVPDAAIRRPDAPSVDESGAASVAPIVPPLTSEDLITDPSREEEAITRVWALAARHRFDGAREQLLVINGWPDAGGDRSRSLADRIGAAAMAHAWDDDETVCRWLRDWSINLWYQWGAGATAGGEGMARAEEIRAAEAGWARLDARRDARWGRRKG